MKNLFVPYEIAHRLKELGFNEPCVFVYIDKRVWIIEQPAFDEGVIETANNNHISNITSAECTAPLYQQVVDWLREEHKIHIGIWSFDHQYNMDREHRFAPILNYDLLNALNIQRETHAITPKFESADYYEAYNKAIEEALKLI